MNLFSLLFGKKTETPPAVVEEQAKEAVTVAHKPPSQSVDQSRWSDAELKFLAGFLNGAGFEPDQRSYWANTLGQAPAKTVQRLIHAELLAPAALAAKLESAFKATEVKAFLKECGLPVSGKKADMIARLIDAGRAAMEAKVAHITAYICTPSGRVLAEAYLAREAEHKRQARERSFDLVRAGDLRQACSTVAEYECAQVFSRGIGVDWSRRPSPEDLQQLHAILEAKPAILKNVSSGDWPVLQQAAAMMELWGERSAQGWLPAAFVGASNLDPETAVRMVLFAGGNRAKLEQYRRVGCTKVEVSGCGEDSCPVCRKISSKKYRVAQAPELPHPECTHEMGCRCLILPVFE